MTGPTMVMGGNDDEVGDLLKAPRFGLDEIENDTELTEYVEEKLVPLLDEAERMVQKEEGILFSTSAEKLSDADWADIPRGSEEAGYAFIDPPEEVGKLARVAGRRRGASLRGAR